MKHKRAEISYWIEEKYWGKGIANKALKLMLHHAFKRMKLHRVYANVCTINKRSVRLLEKNGFVHEGTKRSTRKMGNRYYDVDIYSILEKEYHSSSKT
jgi:RimJ/RimL family protein N-acetyltransferase